MMLWLSIMHKNISKGWQNLKNNCQFFLIVQYTAKPHALTMESPIMTKSTMNIANKNVKQSLQLGTPVAADNALMARKESRNSTLQ